jgi:hypothetical protein
MRCKAHLTLIASFALLSVSCGSEASDYGGGLVLERDSAGDTLVVRTVSGSTWGGVMRMVPEMSIGELEGELEYILGSVVSLGVGGGGTVYLVDRQVPELRAYDADGVYLGTYGGPGEGPGELKSPDGGLAVLTDGRIIVRDPGNARLQEFNPDGTPGEAWTVVRGGFNTSRPLWWDRGDNVYINVLLDPEADIRNWRTGLARITPEGTPADTLEPPDSGFEPPSVEVRVETEGGVNVSRNGVPFSASEEWVLHPNGHFVHGVSHTYAITLGRPEGPLRIERAVELLPVKAGERAYREESITRNFRRMKPGWRWDGPPIPDEKPAFGDLYAGRDGRIWVGVPQEGIEEDNPDYDPTEEGSQPTRWREPTAFDVFEEEGVYLGRVEAPADFSAYPTPVFDGDHVWAVTRDELGVQRVVRFRLTRDDGGQGE